ncbi:MAG TPA: hypothetical protein VHE55_11785 [Fimbriimonadaceae bacterium]|nr:hypothetical protein [Fimbriimonadaceae bacterium]
MNKRLISVCALALAAAMALAQGGPPGGGFGGGFGPGMMMGGPGGNEMGLLSRKDVQDDLALSADQKAKIGEMQKKYRPQRGGPGGPGGGPGGGGGGFGGPPGQGGGDFDPDQMRAEMEKRQAEQKKEVAAILTESQVKRLGEIKIQMAGNMAVMDPEVQEALNITDDQKSEMHEAMDQMRENMRPPEGGGDGEPPDFKQMQAQMKKMQDDMNAAIGKVLTADQKAKLKAMGGKPFKRVDPPMGQRGPGGPGGPGGGSGF